MIRLSNIYSKYKSYAERLMAIGNFLKSNHGMFDLDARRRIAKRRNEWHNRLKGAIGAAVLGTVREISIRFNLDESTYNYSKLIRKVIASSIDLSDT